MVSFRMSVQTLSQLKISFGEEEASSLAKSVPC